MGFRKGLFLLMNRYALGCLSFMMIGGMLFLTNVISKDSVMSPVYMVLASLIMMWLPAKGKLFRRLLWIVALFVGSFILTGHIYETMKISYKVGTSAKIFTGINLILPVVLGLLTYNLIVRNTVLAVSKVLKAVAAVIMWPFKKMFAKSNFLKNLWVKFSGEPSGCDVKKTMAEVDALGNGDTYMKGRIFEEYVAQIYKTIGYRAQTTTEMRAQGTLPPSIQRRGGSGEQGVDVVVEVELQDQDTQKWRTHRLLVQCKHYSSKVDNKAIQEIVAAMPLYRGDYAAVVTNSYFTEPAKELARVHNVTLIDRAMLPELMEKAERAWKARNEE